MQWRQLCVNFRMRLHVPELRGGRDPLPRHFESQSGAHAGQRQGVGTAAGERGGERQGPHTGYEYTREQKVLDRFQNTTCGGIDF